jgi:hypothetical protein
MPAADVDAHIVAELAKPGGEPCRTLIDVPGDAPVQPLHQFDQSLLHEIVSVAACDGTLGQNSATFSSDRAPYLAVFR